MHVRVEGLSDLRRNLRRVEDAEGLAEVRDGLRAAAAVVAVDAKRRVPAKSGKARDSIRANVSGNRAFVVGGKARVPYYGWLDFGTRNPRSGQPRRIGPWKGTGQGPRGGRFIYKAIEARSRQVAEVIELSLERAIRRLGL